MLTRIVTDTFTEAGDTALASHVPDLGTSWTLIAGAATVVATGDYVRDNNANDENSFFAAPGAGGVEMDVRGKIWLDPTVATYRSGVSGRRNLTNLGYTFVWDRNDGKYKIDEGVTQVTLTEAYPGDWAELLLQIRTARKSGIVGGVEKVAMTNDAFPTIEGAGIILLNFANAGVDKARLDDFSLDVFTIDPFLTVQFRAAP